MKGDDLFIIKSTKRKREGSVIITSNYHQPIKKNNKTCNSKIKVIYKKSKKHGNYKSLLGSRQMKSRQRRVKKSSASRQGENSIWK